jgi:predicted RNase H-like HicB family nuclease
MIFQEYQTTDNKNFHHYLIPLYRKDLFSYFELVKKTGDRMKKKFTAVINKEENWYVAHCVELDVVSQGKTIEEAQANLKEAVELYLESFEPDDYPGSDSEIILYPFEVAVNG